MSSTNKKIILVIPGGGVRSAFQAGFFSKFIESDNFEIDAIYASSMGTILAPLVINKKSQILQTLFFNEINRLDDLFEQWGIVWRILGRFARIFFKLGVFKEILIAKRLWNMLNADERNLAESRCHVNAWNLTEAKEYFFTGKDLYDGMCLSTRLWLLVPPTRYKNSYFCDGGSCHLFPITPLLDDKVPDDTMILFVDSSPRVSKEPKVPSNALSLMFNLHDEALNTVGKLQLQLLKAKFKHNLFVIRPSIKNTFKTSVDFDKRKMQEYFHDGENMYHNFVRMFQKQEKFD